MILHPTCPVIQTETAPLYVQITYAQVNFTGFVEAAFFSFTAR
jgi:hypothetical protein